MQHYFNVNADSSQVSLEITQTMANELLGTHAMSLQALQTA